MSILLLYFGFIKKEYINVKYSEDNSINYKVYLHKNDYFATPYLEENRTYITNLIDYLDIDFHYNLKLSEKINGDYKYSVIAKVKANKPNGDKGYYWSKDYVLVPSKSVAINNSDNLSINENVKVNYNKYNELLGSFKKEYSLAPQGLLDIILNVESTGNGEVFTEPIDIVSDMSLSVPLLEKAVEANISKNAASNNNTITMINKNYLGYHRIASILGIIALFITIIITVATFRNKKKFNEENVFDVTLNKILASHDSIIANVATLPDISDMKLIEVTTFDELIDVYNEVRMPINFYNSKEGEEAIFIIVNDNMAWRFILGKDNLENHRDYEGQIVENKEEVSTKVEDDSEKRDLYNTSKYKFSFDELEKTLSNLNLNFGKLKDHKDEEK
jgi:hypothetical protein